MFIQNRLALGDSKLRQHALEIIEVGIERVLPANIIRSTLQYDHVNRAIRLFNDEFRLEGRLFVIGGGKASGLMAKALEDIIGPENITAGVVNCKKSGYGTCKVMIVAAGHPVPNKRGILGVKAMMALKEAFSIDQNDLIVCLISGGGSALMPYPVGSVSLADKQAVTRLLLASGGEITEVNVVRKHLSKVKGGNLGRYFAPTRIVSLILSDVVGNNASVIASGPTVSDPSTFQDALNILTRYGLLKKMPASAADYLTEGCRGEAPETPKLLDNCSNYIIGDSQLALRAMSDKAAEMGYKPCIITSEQTGDTTQVAWDRASEIIRAGMEYDTFLIGGETTLKLAEGAGRGGRNQHYAATSILAMRDCPRDWLVASVGTDGSDFMPGVAGAIVDNHSWEEARRKKLDINSYLKKYDSNILLSKLGCSLLLSRNTGTNVGDVIIYMLK